VNERAERMLIETWHNHVFGLCPSSNTSKKKTQLLTTGSVSVLGGGFQKLDLFPFSGKKDVGNYSVGYLTKTYLFLRDTKE
jgi:hypothetical protein